MITPEELQEIERLDREATPGPWTDTRYSSEDEHGPHIEDRFESTVAVCSVSVDEHSANGTFIARARTLLPRLAAAFAEQTATIAALAAGIEAADLRALQAEEALAKAKDPDR